MGESITPTRMILYIAVLMLIPIFYAIYSTRASQASLDRLITRIDTTQENAFLHEKKLAPNRAVLAAYRDADRSYLDKYVESIPLLQAEVTMLQQALNNPVVAPDPFLISRMEALKKNTIQFSEGTAEPYPFFKETAETIARPVEVDDSDIRKILSEIEGVSIGSYEPGPHRPQLIITDYKLERKATPRQGQVYSLTLKLIKREYL